MNTPILRLPKLSSLLAIVALTCSSLCSFSQDLGLTSIGSAGPSEILTLPCSDDDAFVFNQGVTLVSEEMASVSQEICIPDDEASNDPTAVALNPSHWQSQPRSTDEQSPLLPAEDNAPSTLEKTTFILGGSAFVFLVRRRLRRR